MRLCVPTGAPRTVRIGATSPLAVTGKTVERRDEHLVISAAEVPARELSGFYLVDCDEARALDIAARLPVITHGVVEVRPLMSLPDFR